MDRFADALQEATAKFTYMEVPRGSMAHQARAGGRRLGLCGRMRAL